MYMRSVVVFVLAFLFGFTVKSQEINYNHKSIVKEINRLWNIEDSRSELRELNNQGLCLGKFYVLENNLNKFVYVGRVNSCRAGGCSIDNHKGGASEYFDYFVCFNEKGIVEGVKVFNYAATHGYEIAAKGWLKQFLGYSSKEVLEVGKNIDSISGATISVFAITEDIQMKTQILSKYLRK